VRTASQTTGRRVWFAGFAMNSTSTAVQNDVELVARRFSELGGPVLEYEDSNGPQKDKLRFPFATPATLAEAVQQISSHAGPDDIVVVFISSHGNRKILSVNVAHHELKPLTATQLSTALAPLGNRPTVVILAACFSGSFLPDVQAERRIVITSASGERASFGCQADSRNTYFTEALFANGFDVSKSLLRTMADAKVRRRTT
jgi:Peptidase C13 family